MSSVPSNWGEELVPSLQPALIHVEVLCCFHVYLLLPDGVTAG